MNTAPSLPELQRRFADGVLRNNPGELSEWIAGNGLEPESRLQIYRNVVFNNLTAALHTAYPAVLKLVGHGFFETAAAFYIRNYPSASGNLQDYGAHFAELLARLPEVAHLPYLVDVARLEWARQQAYLAADEATLNSSALATVTESAYDRLHFRLHPSVRLITSKHPVLDIWLFCQETSPGHLQLREQGQEIALWRDGTQVAMQALDAGSSRFLNSLLKNLSFADSYNAAVQAKAEFDLTACLQWLFKTGLVAGLRLS